MSLKIDITAVCTTENKLRVLLKTRKVRKAYIKCELPQGTQMLMNRFGRDLNWR